MNADLYDLFESGGAFSNPLSAASSGASGLITGATSGITNINKITDTQVKAALSAGGLNPAKLAAGTTMLTAAGGGVTTLVSYGSQTVSETFSRVSTVNAYTNGLSAIGRAPTSCDTVNDAFRIIQETGAQWMASMESALSVVNAKIGELYDLASQGVSAGLAKIQALAATVAAEIDKAVAAVNAVVASIQKGIADELAHLESLANKCINFCMSSELVSWMKDSCVAGAINQMASPALKNALS